MRSLACTVVAIASAAVLAAPAGGADPLPTLQVQSGALLYEDTDGTGHRSDLHVDVQDGSYHVHDTGGFTTGPGCSSTGPADAYCPVAGITRSEWRLKGQRDDVYLDGMSIPATIDSGPGGGRLYGSSASDTITGGDDVEWIWPGSGDDVVHAGGGADEMDAWPSPGAPQDAQDGHDVLDGGPGFDMANYQYRTHDVTLRINGQADDGEAGEGDDVHAEHLITGSGNDLIRGTDADETLAGQGGDDYLVPGKGTDWVLGGQGFDRVSYAERTAPMTVRLDTSVADLGNGELDRPLDIEKVYGGSGDDHLIGDAGPNVLVGNGGDDYLQGHGGRDDLQGGPGDHDRASFINAPQPVNVSLDGVRNDGMPGENTLVESDVEGAYGSEHDDTLTGNAGANFLRGYGGADTLDPKGGKDDVGGGDGDDSIQVADGEVDKVVCGAGSDFVAADPIDRLASDCEGSPAAKR